jgi:hypothetical protein
VRDVSRNRLGREYELCGDLPIGETSRDKLGDLVFALAEQMPRFCWPGRIERAGQAGGGIDVAAGQM